MTDYRAGILGSLNVYDSRYVQWCLPPDHRIAAVRSPGLSRLQDDYLIEGPSLPPAREGEHIDRVVLGLAMRSDESGPGCELIGSWVHDPDVSWRIDHWPSTDGFIAAMDNFREEAAAIREPANVVW